MTSQKTERLILAIRLSDMEKRMRAWIIVYTLKPQIKGSVIYWSKQEALESYRHDLLKYHKVKPVTIIIKL